MIEFILQGFDVLLMLFRVVAHRDASGYGRIGPVVF